MLHTKVYFKLKSNILHKIADSVVHLEVWPLNSWCELLPPHRHVIQLLWLGIAIEPWLSNSGCGNRFCQRERWKCPTALIWVWFVFAVDTPSLVRDVTVLIWNHILVAITCGVPVILLSSASPQPVLKHIIKAGVWNCYQQPLCLFLICVHYTFSIKRSAPPTLPF